ncbi:AraC family transcriptional regulator [Lentilactobacillus parafarraginis]|uniref:Transcriptional regulator, AraC family n=3 Tax=Lentilactobacillus parafarraginis TaxID=390842 RepID=A0A0R1YI70_9LACO|nr:AraC family transcriptional regulator [Lentilactobacillus parafarraginis]KRM41882.1 transcriptional regulator, AraC family [Lentilactobacillus parafarraginis DSM 18390 = JCM 14109]TLQ17995.1 AraC family transcriptional regulator [Lentilactobacillus parafarraginis]
MTNQYLSISCLPLPTYVQSGHVVFNPGDRHPNRNNFQFFVMIFMVRGKLYIAEDDQEYVVGPGEMFILQPKHHHYSWKPMDQTTEYYWVHFSVTGCYLQASEPQELHSVIPVPSLHYYTPKMTLFLSKHSHITNMPGICALVKKIFQNSAAQNAVGFWQTQQLFLDLLQQVQSPATSQSQTAILATQIQRYLRDHFDEKITNEKLGQVFHVHPNSVTSSMKKTFGITPNLFLTKYRLEEAVKRLLSTSEQISRIAADVGYQNVYYFSMAFKRRYGVSPLSYRNQYADDKVGSIS